MAGTIRKSRLVAVLVLSLTGALAVQAAFSGPASADFEEGIVNVTGYGWSTSQPSVDVPLSAIANTQNGQRTYTVLEIIQEANDRTNQFTWATIPGIEISLPGSTTSIGCSGDEVRTQSSKCPTFRSTETATTMRTGSGQTYEYKNANPQIYIPRSKDIDVDISPRRKTIKSGQSIAFTATVKNSVGTVKYSWNFGDGKSATTSTGKISHVFKGNDRTFNVVVKVKGSGSPRTSEDVAFVTIGKVKKKPPKKKDKPNENDNESPPPDDGAYIPGYVDDYGDGTGTGTGSGIPAAPSSPSDQQPKQEEPQQPVDDGLETVSGQLVDPSQIATIAPPSDSPSTGTEGAAPAEKASDGGGSLSEGAMTAIGVGALLGLGGLAEAGAFAGLRRFRFRP